MLFSAFADWQGDRGLFNSHNYGKVKCAILSKYDLSPETYRERICSLEVHAEERPQKLYVRLKELYGKSIQPNGKTILEK